MRFLFQIIQILSLQRRAVFIIKFLYNDAKKKKGLILYMWYYTREKSTLSAPFHVSLVTGGIYIIRRPQLRYSWNSSIRESII